LPCVPPFGVPRRCPPPTSLSFRPPPSPQQHAPSQQPPEHRPSNRHFAAVPRGVDEADGDVGAPLADRCQSAGETRNERPPVIRRHADARPGVRGSGEGGADDTRASQRHPPKRRECAYNTPSEHRGPRRHGAGGPPHSNAAPGDAIQCRNPLSSNRPPPLSFPHPLSLQRPRTVLTPL